MNIPTKRSLAIIVVMFAFACSAIAMMPGTLVLTGTFHGDEVSVADGAELVGLFPKGEGFELARTKLGVETVEDVVLDAPGKMTGKEITVDRADEPVFMLDGVEGLTEGEVETAFTGWEWLKPGSVVEIDLAGVVYTLSAYGEGKDEWSIRDYSLVLARGETSQVLASFEICCNESMPSLIWAGDIDRDGMPDFYMDLSDHYNKAVRTVFLSGLAKKGELVGRAAELVTYGC